MNGIVGDARQYRKHAVRIMGTHVPPANWQKIPFLVKQLSVSNHGADDVVSTIARFHAAFEKIHPFSDDNGRSGLLMMPAQALSSNIAPPIVLKERKQAYYKYQSSLKQKKNICLLSYSSPNQSSFLDNL